MTLTLKGKTKDDPAATGPMWATVWEWLADPCTTKQCESSGWRLSIRIRRTSLHSSTPM